jgi:hypothetical protein
LQHNFAVRKRVKRYKKPRIKAMSQKNRADRVKYGEKHQDKTISRFWKYIYFTDEAHFNSRDLASKDEYMLRQPDNQPPGQRMKPGRPDCWDHCSVLLRGMS